MKFTCTILINGETSMETSLSIKWNWSMSSWPFWKKKQTSIKWKSSSCQKRRLIPSKNIQKPSRKLKSNLAHSILHPLPTSSHQMVIYKGLPEGPKKTQTEVDHFHQNEIFYKMIFFQESAIRMAKKSLYRKPCSRNTKEKSLDHPEVVSIKWFSSCILL